MKKYIHLFYLALCLIGGNARANNISADFTFDINLADPFPLQGVSSGVPQTIPRVGTLVSATFDTGGVAPLNDLAIRETSSGALICTIPAGATTGCSGSTPAITVGDTGNGYEKARIQFDLTEGGVSSGSFVLDVTSYANTPVVEDYYYRYVGTANAMLSVVIYSQGQSELGSRLPFGSLVTTSPANQSQSQTAVASLGGDWYRLDFDMSSFAGTGPYSQQLQLSNGYSGLFDTITLPAYPPADTTPPSVSFTSASTGAPIIAGQKMRISDIAATISDATPVRVLRAYLVGSSNGDLDLPTVFDVAAGRLTVTPDADNLPDGSYVVYVEAVDQANNYTRPGIYFVADSRAPELAFMTAAGGPAVNEGSYDVSGLIVTASDGNGIAPNATFTLTGGALTTPVSLEPAITLNRSVDPAVTSFALSLPASVVLSAGRYQIDANVSDSAGTSTAVTLTFYVDMAPPELTLYNNGVKVDPQAESTVTDLTKLTFTIVDDADPNPYLLSRNFVYQNNGNGNLYLQYTWDQTVNQYRFSDIGGGGVAVDGVGTLSMQIADQSGKTASYLYSLNMAVQGPQIRLLKNGAALNDGAVLGSIDELTIEVSDNEAVTIDEVRITESNSGQNIIASVVAGQPVQNVTTFTINPIALSENAGSSAPYVITVTASDASGNMRSGTGTFFIDATPPNAILLAAGVEFIDGAEINSFADLRLNVTDNSGLTPNLISAAVSGGPTNAAPQNISWTAVNSGEFSFADMTLASTAGSTGTPYLLTVSYADMAGNQSVTTYSFNYAARVIGNQGQSSTQLLIPAIAQSFSRPSGRNAVYSEPLTTVNGSPTSATLPVYANMPSDANLPLLVNGVIVNPGDTILVASAYDFAASGGILDMPLAVVADGQVGESRITLYTDDPSLPQMVLNVVSWSPTLSWTGENQVEQFLGEINLSMNVTQSTPCRLSINGQLAASSDVFLDPVCQVVFTNLPSTIVAVENPQVGLRGSAETQGMATLAYELYLYNGSQPVLIGTGDVSLDVTPVNASYETDVQNAEIYQSIQQLAIGIKQSAGTQCKLTMSVQRAMDNAVYSRVCYLEWLSIPAGLSQADNTTTPELKGAIQEVGLATVSWRVSIYTTTQEKVVISEGSQQLNIVSPPTPIVTLEPAGRTEVINGRYFMALDGGNAANALIETPSAKLTIKHFVDDNLVKTENIAPQAGAVLLSRSYIYSPAKPLWQENRHTIRVEYTDLPTIGTSSSISVVARPSNNLRLRMEPIVSGADIVNTSRQAMNISMDNYDPGVMGEWDIVVNNMPSRDTKVEVSAQALLNAAGNTLDIDLMNMQTARLVASATLRSPYPEYSRVIDSRVVSFSILEGRALTGEIVGKRLSGRAPFRAYLSVAFDDRRNASLADVSWSMSTDGASWSPVASLTNRKAVLYRIYERGSYQIKAIITNSITGAQYETAPVTIVAYEVPDFKIKGSLNSITGVYGFLYPYFSDPDILEPAQDAAAQSLTQLQDTLSLCISRQLNCAAESGLAKLIEYSRNSSMARQKYVIEYSIDKGETWNEMVTPAYVVNEPQPGEYLLYIRARSLEAPESDIFAYNIQKAKVVVNDASNKFKAIILGPRKVEAGKTSRFTSIRRDPYYNMLYFESGYWTLPDGTQVYGDTLDYTPTQADAASGTIKLQYTAAMLGRPIMDGVAEKVLGVWEYIWPSYTLESRQQYSYSPSQLSLFINQTPLRAYPENLDIQWTFPAGLNGKLTYGNKRATVTVPEPGDYTFIATLTDSRGNQTTLSKTLTFTPPPAYNMTIVEYGEKDVRYAPHKATFRALFDGGHQQDRIQRVEYILDGAPQQEGERPGYFVIGPGTHTVTINAYSRMGQTPSVSKTFDVLPNSRPSCQTSAWPAYGNKTTFVATCSDVNGRVVAQEWYIDGQLIARGNKLSVNNDDIGAKEIYTRAMDNEGEYSVNYYFP